MLRYAWKREKASTASMFAVCLLSVLATAGISLSLRSVINAIVSDEWSAVVGSTLILAVCYGFTVTFQHTVWDLLQLLSDDAALEISRRINGWIVDIEGLEHLEQSDFLDRLDQTRNSILQISMSLWQMILAVRSGLQLVVMLLLLGSVSPWLFGLLPLAGLALALDNLGKKMVVAGDLASSEMFRLQRHLFNVSTRAESGKDIRVAGASMQVVCRQADAWDDAVHQRFRARQRSATLKFAGWTLFSMGSVTALLLVLNQVLSGTGTPGDVAMTITLVSGLRQVMRQIVGRTASTVSTLAATNSYFWLEEFSSCSRRDQVHPPVSSALPRLIRGIRLNGVSYRYPGAKESAIEDMSVDIPAGSVVAIVGEYGSGKSTLVKLLAKFYSVEHGTIQVDGQDISTLATDRWRERLSAAFQDFARLETTVGESVGIGDVRSMMDIRRVEKAVRDADCQALVSQLPNGLNTQLGTALGGVELSEGGWQRVALARAAMRDAPLLQLLDEPTASLDAPSEAAIFKQQMERAREVGLRTGAITIMVSHRFSTLTKADVILVLDRGRLIESGTHEELVGIESGRYAELYQIQSDAYKK